MITEEKVKGLFIGEELQEVLKACDDKIEAVKYAKSESYRYETVVIQYYSGKNKIVNVTGCSNILTLVKVAQAVRNGV